MFSNKVDALGTVAWWGMTPCVDLLKFVEKNKDQNIYLIGPCDSRHILKTLSELILEENKNAIHFTVIEQSPLNYARCCLQLMIAFASHSAWNVQDRSEIFLELFGNSLIRDSTADSLKTLSTVLLNCVTNPEYQKSIFPYINLQSLKFIERDIMENAFKFWKEDAAVFDAKLCWDLRVRQDLGTRYDAIPNVFDWDVSITLHERGADQIHPKEYARWRGNGLAFELREASYTAGNKCLASIRQLPTKNMDKVARWGYWGDIVCSPYLSFGVDYREFEFMGKRVNSAKVYTASALALEATKKIMFQLMKRKKYISKDSAENITIEEITDEEVDETGEKESPFAVMSLPVDFKVDFLPAGCFGSLPTRHRSRFSRQHGGKPITMLFVGCSSVHLLESPDLMASENALQMPLQKPTPDKTINNNYDPLFDDIPDTTIPFQEERSLSLWDITSEDCIMVVENVLYIVSLKAEQVEAYVERVTRLAENVGFVPAKKFESMRDLNLVFNRSLTAPVKHVPSE